MRLPQRGPYEVEYMDQEAMLPRLLTFVEVPVFGTDTTWVWVGMSTRVTVLR